MRMIIFRADALRFSTIIMVIVYDRKSFHNKKVLLPFGGEFAPNNIAQ